MRLRYLFVIVGILALSGWVAVGMLAFRVRPLWFYGAEAGAVLTVCFLAYFYYKALSPIRTLSGGMDLLKAQDWNSALARVGQPEVDSIVEVFNQVMARLREQRLRLVEQNHLLNLLVEHAPTGIVILGDRDAVTLANPAAQKVLPVIGDVLMALKEGETETIRIDASRVFKCSRHHFVDRGVTHSFFILEDISDSIRAAERAAYEKVIRIISHEVNNTVAGLSSTLDVAAQSVADSGLSGLLRACCERSLALSRFIGRFAEVVRLPDPVLVSCDLGALAAHTVDVMTPLADSREVNMSVRQAGGASKVAVDADQIEQVLINIVKNSIESIGRGGDIIITVGDRTLVVADNGRGISPEKSLKIFTPFYTDRPDGQGVGLTLVREILIRHGAEFSLRTDSDGYTRFKIKF